MVTSKDSSLRQYLLATVVSLLVLVSGCYMNSMTARVDANEKKVDTLDQKVNATDKQNAVIEQDLKDFRKSFEDFKTDWKADDARHHRPDSR